MSTGSKPTRNREGERRGAFSRLPRPKLPTPRLPKKPEILNEDFIGADAELARVSINRMALIAAGVGVVTGLLVALLNWTVIWTERAIYGVDHINASAPALNVSPERTGASMLVLGFVLSWVMWAYHRFGPKAVAVGGAMKARRMPVIKTLSSCFIQVTSVAVGAPVGRENAPRLAGALSASRAADWLKLDREARRLIVASAAGAALGASFHLPLAGAIFSLELLLRELTARSIVVSMMTSAVAVATTGLFVESHPIFRTVPLDETAQTLFAAGIIGVVAGLIGHLFGQAARVATEYSPGPGKKILWQMPLGYVLIALAAYSVPEYGANNRWAAGTVLAEELPIKLLVVLVLLRMFTYLVALRVGTIGGMLTPAFANGALIGAIIGTLLHPLLPHVPVEAFALLGAAAFLSTAMVAPMFGMIAAVEFTDMVPQGYLPVFTAVVAAAVAVRMLGIAAARRAPYVQGMDPEESRSMSEAEHKISEDSRAKKRKSERDKEAAPSSRATPRKSGKIATRKPPENSREE